MLPRGSFVRRRERTLAHVPLGTGSLALMVFVSQPFLSICRRRNAKGYSSTYLAMGFANVGRVLEY